MADQPKLLLSEIINETKEGDWYARVIAYTSPNGLLTHPDAIYYHVLEVGRKKDLPWARAKVQKLAGY